MALTDPQSITIDGGAVSLPRVKTEGYRSEYLSSDEDLKMIVSHQEKKGRTRRMVRLDLRTIAADPLTAANEYKTTSVYLVVDEPEYGFEDAVLDDLIDGLVGWLTAANIGKLLTHQH